MIFVFNESQQSYNFPPALVVVVKDLSLIWLNPLIPKKINIQKQQQLYQINNK